LIRLLILDVDGCMTDGKITYTNTLDELKSFNVKDGFAIKQWLRLGYKAAIVTGRESKIVSHRADEMGVDYLYQGVKDKKEALLRIEELSKIGRNEMAAIGDDLNDYRLLKEVGLSFAPSDAVSIIQESVDVVLKKRGGEGAVREMIEYILKKEGRFEEYLEHWIGDSG